MRLTFTVPRVTSASDVRHHLEALVRQDVDYLMSHDVPPLYASGVIYRPEPRGREDWDPVPVVLGRGWGDCEDLAAWRAAELRVLGEQHARADAYRSRVRPDGSAVWHAVTVREDGTIEDPSAQLGMRVRAWHRRDGDSWRS